ncbi:uracil-DNA glycosylase [Hazenella sp. IB182357]|uniref:Uracil-DNA glycosylase n=1 Tax=Polycladospora coralii TaxID=2771432 RepID=A0A926N9X8_9BACL|nr:uracil-DNA glycosylase [Polycladospora coralii]MBD1372562.1 uracil-DNA glycosylase [Polycladospora coralii]MBS7531315.1 uracil-DNA glycosylase [Polycladospora coralii]
MPILKNDWNNYLKDEFHQPYYLELRRFLQKEYQEHTIYPDQWEIFSALQLTSLQETRVVIIGQDPYHGPGQAHGLSFSVKPGVKVPPSLQNIYKELQHDIGCTIPNHGYLLHWAEQGVLMLNNVLTVRAHTPNSHRQIGWENFTEKVIRILNERKAPIVFLLWGKQAQEKKMWITHPHHLIIESAHPSPFSAHRGFFGSRPFSRTNTFLQSISGAEIDWQIPSL